MNINKIIEICKRKNLQDLPALKQLIRAKEENLKEDAERISSNIIEFLQENNLYHNSSNPPNRQSNPPTIPPNK